MKIDTIRLMRNRAPFRPFNLHLDTGETLPVGHSEQLAIDSEGEVLSLFTATGWNLIEAQAVRRVSTEKRKAKPVEAKREG